MKKVFFAFIVAIGLISCQSHEFGDSVQEMKDAQYEAEFTKAFGTPSPTQTWGFKKVAITRAHNVNGNLWYKDWERPVNVTDAEKSINGDVLKAFSVKRENAVNEITLNWDNYWVQQVYQSTNTYRDGFGNSTGDIHTKMNKIIAYNEAGFTSIEYPAWNGYQPTEVLTHYEHVNNFNNGTNTTTYTDDETHQQYVGTTLMVGMGNVGTNAQFGYHNTVDSKDHFEYIVLEINGSYYVGFDFCASHPEGQEANKNMDVERDWIFNDWIVKISPAVHKGTPPTLVDTGRILCEDLGSSDGSDFDFNDVVFDAYLYSDKTCKIELLAAGGTLELTVGGQEVHNLFDVSTKTMVNTLGKEGNTIKDPVTFWISNVDAIINIPIYVRNEYAAWTLSAQMGEAPQKICCEIGFKWPIGRTRIDTAYPGFAEWVKSEKVTWPQIYIPELVFNY